MSGAVHRREPDPEKMLKLPIEETAPYLFEQLYNSGTASISLKNTFLDDQVAIDYPASYRKAISARLMEAWTFLERSGMIMPNPGSDSGWYTFSPTAMQLGTADALKTHLAEAQRGAAAAYERAAREAEEMKARAQTEIDAAIQGATEKADSILQLARQTAQGVSLDDVQKQFAKAADECFSAVKLWATLSVAIIVAFCLILIGFVTWWAPSFASGAGGTGASAAAVYHTVIRVTILTAIAAIATFCLKVLRAQMHLREQNLHRKRVANSMAAFLGAASPEQRDAILAHVVDAITVFGNSGLLPDGDETMSPAKVILESVPRAFSQKP